MAKRLIFDLFSASFALFDGHRPFLCESAIDLKFESAIKGETNQSTLWICPANLWHHFRCLVATVRCDDGYVMPNTNVGAIAINATASPEWSKSEFESEFAIYVKWKIDILLRSPPAPITPCLAAPPPPACTASTRSKTWEQLRPNAHNISEHFLCVRGYFTNCNLSTIFHWRICAQCLTRFFEWDNFNSLWMEYWIINHS